MKVKKYPNIIKRIIIALLCMITVLFSMPSKSKAGPFQDFIEIVLNVPDAVMALVNDFIGESDEINGGPTYVDVNLEGLVAGGNDEGRVYNILVTPYEIITNGQTKKYTDRWGNEHEMLTLPILNADFFHVDNSVTTTQKKSNEILRPAIANVYKNLRNFCMVLMLLVLLYIGIKIMISASAEQQSKYKKNLVDWVVGFCLLFIMHYFMVFIMSANTMVTDMLANGESQSYYIGFGQASDVGTATDDGSIESAVSGGILGGITTLSPSGAVTGALAGYGTNKLATQKNWNQYEASDDTLFSALHLAAQASGGKYNVGNDGSTSVGRTDWGDNGSIKLSTRISVKRDGDIVCIYKGNIMEYVRTLSSFGATYAGNYTSSGLKSLNKDGAASAWGLGTKNDMIKLEYGIFYLALVIETVMFLTTYIKRLIQLAFLTMIAPFVALMYPVDKIGDGKAQSFDTWFKDYFFGVLIQPIHLLIYTVFITAASQLFAVNIVYAIAIYVFMIPAEKYIKKIFGFEKGGSGPAGGGLPSAMGHGIGMDALNRYAGIGPGTHGGSGDKGSKKPKVAKIKDDPNTLAPASSGAMPAGSGTAGGNSNGAGNGRANRSGSQGSGRNGNRGNAQPANGGNAAPRGLPIGGFVGNTSQARRNQPVAGGNQPAANGNQPAAGGVGGRLKRFAQYAPQAVGQTIGRRVLRGVTGGEHSDLSAGGKLVGMSILKNAAKGVVRAGGMTLGATAGIMLSSADAIANGNFDPKKIAESTIVGLKAGGKQADNLTGAYENFEDEVNAQRAQIDEEYKKDLRRDNTWTSLAPEINQLEAKDRERYKKLIDNYAPYIDIKSIGDLKALDAIENDVKVVEGAKGTTEEDQAALVKESYENAKSWKGDLRSDELAESFRKRWAEDHNMNMTNPDGTQNQAVMTELEEHLKRAKLAQSKFD